jgi:D-alanyl-lipoteichoic acid acyltransferase DltB (MBOAT superfamily)
MLFNSYEFIFLFLPITFGIYFWLNKKRLTQASKAWMVFSSLFFYSWWNVIYLPIMLGSILFNFAVGSTITHINGTKASKKRISSKTMLIFGIIANVLLLVYFKYMDFFIVNLNAMVGTHLDLIHIVLPLGISFFTFTQIAYLVDAYRDEVKEMDYLNYTLFVTFFPHVLAGPILHHKEMMPQFDAVRNKVFNTKNITAGMYLFAIGLFKKVVIADTFVVWVSYGYGSADSLTFVTAWTTSLAYTFQLYFDFSGYTDMALAVALLFNIKLPINFNSPYKALSIQDFWRRWHITLSRFLRDYIYFPLGGNQKGKWRTYSNLFAVFLVGGLWHGASWMFVMWGALHGGAIVLHRVWQSMGMKMNALLAWFITFNFINITWIFFRANEWNDAVNVLRGMFGFNGLGNISELAEFGGLSTIDLVMMLIVFIIGFSVFFTKNSNQMLSTLRLNKKSMLFTVFLMCVGILHLSKVSTFLYFNF